MTLEEILALKPGKQTDDLTAECLHWKRVVVSRRGGGREDDGRRAGRERNVVYAWSDGQRIITNWSPSTNWQDTGRLMEIFGSNPLMTVRLVMGGENPGAVIEAIDFFGPGPHPRIWFAAPDSDPKLAICKAVIRMGNRLYEEA